MIGMQEYNEAITSPHPMNEAFIEAATQGQTWVDMDQYLEEYSDHPAEDYVAARLLSAIIDRL